jgi:hypothetical protein
VFILPPLLGLNASLFLSEIAFFVKFSPKSKTPYIGAFEQSALGRLRLFKLAAAWILQILF